jgi:hypothetical protein
MIDVPQAAQTWPAMGPGLGSRGHTVAIIWPRFYRDRR